MSHRLDSELDRLDKADLDDYIDMIIEKGRVDPFTVHNVKRSGRGYQVALAPSPPKWTCTFCNGTGVVNYSLRGMGGYQQKCPYCIGKGFHTDARNVRRTPRPVKWGTDG